MLAIGAWNVRAAYCLAICSCYQIPNAILYFILYSERKWMNPEKTGIKNQPNHMFS